MSSGEYFFRSDFADILQGLVFEYVPSGVYIWKLCFPLFDPFGPNLTFSERLHQEKGFVAKGAKTEEAIVEFALASPEAQDVFGRQKSIELSEFIRDIELLPYDWRSTRVALIHAASLALIGEVAHAAALMAKFPAASVLGNRDLAAYEDLQTSLHQGLESVQAMLAHVRQKNLLTLGLSQ